MKSLVFLTEAFNANTFRILAKAEIAKLTAEQKTAYEKLLAEFVSWFKTTHPHGLKVKLNVTKLGLLYAQTDVNGGVIVKAAIVADAEGQPDWVPAMQTLKVGQLDVLAQGAGFANYQMLALMSATKLRKGSITFVMNLREGGSKVVGRDGREITIEKTHISQDDLVYAPSDEMSRSIEQASAKAFERQQEAFINKTFEPTVKVAPVTTDEEFNP
jgi:hypothetical protein